MTASIVFLVEMQKIGPQQQSVDSETLNEEEKWGTSNISFWSIAFRWMNMAPYEPAPKFPVSSLDVLKEWPMSVQNLVSLDSKL